METLSSGTFFLKRVFPVLWIGFVLVIPILILLDERARRDGMPGLVLMSLAMLAFGIVLFRKLVWDLADNVELQGDVLIVSKGGEQERVRLTDIVNISVTQMTNPTRISLRLRRIGKFGDEIVFIPRSEFRFNPFARNAVAEKLIRLVDKARQMDSTP